MACGGARSTTSIASARNSAARDWSGLMASPHAYECVRMTMPAGVTRRPLTSVAVVPRIVACSIRPGGSSCVAGDGVLPERTSHTPAPAIDKVTAKNVAMAERAARGTPESIPNRRRTDTPYWGYSG